MSLVLSIAVGLLLVGVCLTVHPGWQSSTFRRTVNDTQHLFNKGQATVINEDETLLGLTDEIGAALVVCDETGKPNWQETSDAIMAITESKLQTAEESGIAPALRPHQLSALQSIQSKVDESDEDDQSDHELPNPDVLLEAPPAFEDDQDLTSPDVLLETALDVVFSDPDDQKTVRLDALKQAGITTIGDVLNHDDLSKIEGINKRIKNRLVSAVTGYLKTAQEITSDEAETLSDPE